MRPFPLRVFGTALIFMSAMGLTLSVAWPVLAQEVAAPATDAPAAEVDASDDEATDDEATDDEAARFAAFTKAMTNVKLVGRFTIAGDDDKDPIRDEYTISSVVKVGEADLWIVSARIRYGSVDLTLPVPVEVKWAGKTPVITLDNVTIPGLGTFSSRVVIDGPLYAGTWQHDAVGGHMFGKIVPVEPAGAPEQTPAEQER
jgi:hypothetical protein